MDWGTPLNLTGATAIGAGNIRVVTANVAGHNLTVAGNVNTGSGSIYLASDDNIAVNAGATIGGAGFSQDGLDASEPGPQDRPRPSRCKASAIVTSNTTNNVVPLTALRTPTDQAVYLDISGDVGTPSALTVGSITAGNGGRIVLNATPNAYRTDVTEGEAGAVAMAGSANVLDAGAAGTVELVGRITATTVANDIGTAATPIKVAGGTVVTNSNFGNTFVTGTGATSFNPTLVANTGWSANAGTPAATGQTGAFADLAECRRARSPPRLPTSTAARST